MGFLNAVKIKAEEMTKVAAKKASCLVEIAKNSAAITELNDQIKALYRAIGEQVYVAAQTGNDTPDFSEQFRLISEYKEKVSFHQSEIDRLKN